MDRFSLLLEAFSWLGVVAFALAGALAASRKQLDPVGFILLAALTGFGGGTLRDLLLGVPVFWLNAPAVVGVTIVVALGTFSIAHRVERRFVVLLWADAVGLVLFAVLGAEATLRHGAHPWVAVLMGIVTATFGGLLRDVVANEVPLLLRKEIYATAAALAAAVFTLLFTLGLDRDLAVAIGMLSGFLLRAAAIRRGWSLPAYRARPGRDYPDAR